MAKNLLDYLSIGEENAKTERELTNLSGLKNSAELRQIVHALRLQGAFIVANSNGYFLSDETSDLRAFSKQMHSRSTHILRAVEAIDKELIKRGASD